MTKKTDNAKKLKRRYTFGEELANSITHGVGAVFAVAALIAGVIIANIHSDNYATISMTIYGLSLVALYLSSTLYHWPAKKEKKNVFRVFDHCSIFLLIAGTYTPFTLIALRNEFFVLFGTSLSIGWTIFAISWAGAIVGILLNCIDLKKFEVLSLICYILLGWLAVLVIGPLMKTLSPTCLLLLFLGGILYTFGAGVYVVGRKVKFVHSLWHFFVLGGSVLQFFSAILLLI